MSSDIVWGICNGFQCYERERKYKRNQIAITCNAASNVQLKYSVHLFNLNEEIKKKRRTEIDHGYIS
jgi:phosphoribosylformylglycinamidine (FGAM) synthase-like amidotransferase family enzyme